MNRNVEEITAADTYAWVEGPDRTALSIVPGWNASVGFDVRTAPGVAMGLGATFHHVPSAEKDWSGKQDTADFTAFTAGFHALFGW